MKEAITIRKLDSTEKDIILKIANWYYNEWGTPIDKTYRRIENQNNEDLLFQLILTKGKNLIATGGLGNNVNILKIHPRLKIFGPWIALLYTDKNYRRKGYGEILLQQIESHAKNINLTKIYLYTFTAERLYKRCGWKTIDKVDYKNHETMVMEKKLSK